MERLTSKWPSGLIGVQQGMMPEALERLADYEDTGLDPEEVEIMRESKADAQFMLTELCRLCDYDRLEELARAEQEGRLVVLPCKVGDTVFDIFGGSVKEETIVSITFLISQSVKHMTIHAENHRGAITELELLRFGKTWFLTREEAEAALAGMNVGNIVKVTDLYDEDGDEITEAANE